MQLNMRIVGSNACTSAHKLYRFLFVSVSGFDREPSRMQIGVGAFMNPDVCEIRLGCCAQLDDFSDPGIESHGNDLLTSWKR